MLILLISTLVFSCSDYYCDTLSEAINIQCKAEEDSCIFSFENVFSFEWDSLYIFDSMLYPDEVSEKLGFDCKCKIVPEGSRLVVFTKDGKLVEKYLSQCHIISFVKMREGGVVVVYKSSVFTLKKKYINDKLNYFFFKTSL